MGYCYVGKIPKQLPGISWSYPSLRLRFALAKNSADLRSLEYRSMSVDHDQTLGTLIGFANKLILKSQQGSDRTVLVLAAPLAYYKNKDHVSVTASTTSDAKVYAIGVDEQLKRMVRSNGLDCKLYMAYLHALTSFCLPDPLTLKTGTEEALDVLRSKGVASFEQLSQPSIDVLHMIAQLSPLRRHYPAQKQVMQQTEWDSNLGFLSQHSEFKVVVASLFCRSRSTNVFYPGHDVDFPRLDSTVDTLRKRDSIHSSTFRVAGYGADSRTTLHETPYSGRDQGMKSAQRVSTVAALITRHTNDYHWAAASQTHLWSLMQNDAIVQGVNASVETSRLRYDARLRGSSFAVTMLPALQRWLGTQASRQHTFSIAMWLATLAFEQNADVILLQLLVSCFKTSELAAIRAPDIVSFAPKQGYAVVKQKLRDALVASRRHFNQSPESRWDRFKNEKSMDYSNRRHTGWNRSCEAIRSQVVADLLSQWPSPYASVPVVANASTYFDLDKAISTINKHTQATYRNFLLRGYLMEVEKTMAPLPHRAVQLPPLLPLQPPARVPSERGFVSEFDAFSAVVAPTLSHSRNVLLASDRPPTRSTVQSKPEPRLKGMIQRLDTVAGQSSYELVYAADLKDSLQSLVSRDDPSGHKAAEISRDTLVKYMGRCELYAEQVYDSIVTALRSLPNAAGAASTLQWSRLCPVLLLKQLARDRWSDLSSDWQRCVVTYSLALRALQRAQRLLKLSDPTRKEDFRKELPNSDHANWDPMNYPETLLLEVESGFLAREVQEQIAREMRRPTLKGNEVLQLNMGEGKSSVIVPMAAVSLADGLQLVRVIFAKPQSKQMAQMLISKVGGLVNRRVYYMPFSRSLPLTTPTVESVSAMVRERKVMGGILLVQPEHINSFKLMGLGCYIDGMEVAGRRLISTQDFFDCSSRDIVDESDENFSTRFELIYTMGTQRSIELSPDRWFLVQEVLGILRTIAPAI